MLERQQSFFFVKSQIYLSTKSFSINLHQVHPNKMRLRKKVVSTTFVLIAFCLTGKSKHRIPYGSIFPNQDHKKKSLKFSSLN